MALSRRTFLKALGIAAAGAAAGPLVRVGAAHGAPLFKAKRVVVVSVAGGLRLSESLGMAQGATMPNLFGDVPVVGGSGPAGAPVIAPEYVAPSLVLPKPRAKPLLEEGALVSNLRYAEGAPGHLQGSATLVSGAYNNIDNRPDARCPAPTLAELHRRATNAPSTDAWVLSVLPGFFRALQASDHPEYGARYGASWLSPPTVMTPVVPIVSSGQRSLKVSGSVVLPTISDPPDQANAVRKLTAILDGDTPPYEGDDAFRASAADDAAIEQLLASIYGDDTYASFFPPTFPIGVKQADGSLAGTQDAITTYHAERILQKFAPKVMYLSLFDVDTCHADFNGYLRGQQVADACVAHLWDFIQSTPGLKDETALLVLPEHGRQLAFNGKNPDSLGRSGLDHGGGDDGDRDVWALALGPDFKPGVVAPTNVKQDGRASGRYETIDVVMTAAAIIGQDEAMTKALVGADKRPGLVMEGILK